MTQKLRVNEILVYECASAVGFFAVGYVSNILSEMEWNCFGDFTILLYCLRCELLKKEDVWCKSMERKECSSIMATFYVNICISG